MEQCDVLVIGAGVIGLAVAGAFAARGRETVIVEKETSIGSGVSSRNSEVIHAGIYYPEGSLKARLCVEGKERLYAYCDSRHVGYRRCGKLIVATDENQNGTLDTLIELAALNGVTDLVRLSSGEAKTIEPALFCTGAVHSPSTGIINSHELMVSLLGDVEAAGGVIAYGTEVTAINNTEQTPTIAFDHEDEFSLRARLLVNCAGLDAVAIARLAGVEAPQIFFAKGSYYTLHGRSPFSRLIYPVPEPGGLGVHLTLDLAGEARFGPDVEWIDERDFNVDALRARGFYEAVRKYWPALQDEALVPAYAGIRPKITGPGEASADFSISAPSDPDAPAMINLFGIESPGLTACLAIAEEVVRIAEEQYDA